MMDKPLHIAESDYKCHYGLFMLTNDESIWKASKPLTYALKSVKRGDGNVKPESNLPNH